MSMRLCIVGASGHGREVLDVAWARGYRDFVFLDTNRFTETVEDFPLFQDCPEIVERLAAEGWDFAIGIGDPGREIRRGTGVCHIDQARRTHGPDIKIAQQERNRLLHPNL